MNPDYGSEQVDRDLKLVIRMTGDMKTLFEWLQRWLGDEIEALRVQCRNLESQAKPEIKPGFEDMQYRLHAADWQLARNIRRVQGKIAVLDREAVGSPPLESFHDLADEMLILQGLMRQLLDIRVLVDTAIAELP